MGSRERHMRQRSKTHAIPLIIVSLVGFLFIAGIAFGVGMLGNINRWLSDLPDYTDPDQYMVSEPTTVLDANGTEIATLYVQNRESVTIDQVSQYVLDGTVATEDERFYEHNGVDLIGIARAVMVQLTGGSEGASTITSSWYATPSSQRSSSTTPSSARSARPLSPSRWKRCTQRKRS